MKKYLVVLSVVLMAASCGSSQVKPSPEPTISPTPTPTNQQSVNSYTSPTKYGFSLEYANDFGFSTDINQVKALTYIPVCDDKMVACVFLKKETYPGTNFDGAGVSINVYPDLNTEKKCYQLISPLSSVHVAQPDVTINGVVFKHGTGGDAATGHSELVKIYRNLHNNQCYEISAHVAETNISLYDPGTIKEFDQAVVWDKLQTVVNSFKFTSALSFGQSISLTGTTVCLPHRNVSPDQPQTMECAIGLKDDASGKYYGLKNTNPPFYDTGVKVKVTGTLVDDSKSNYDTVGAVDKAVVVKN